MQSINFIIPTYERHYHLVCLTASLMAQTNPNWTCHIVSDGGDMDKIIELVNYFNNDERFLVSCLEKRFNDWGHTPRNIGLMALEDDDFVCMSGEDNYYVPTFVDEVLKVFTDDTNFVFCNMIHNWRNGEYIPIDSRVQFGRIDIGNVVLRSKYARQIQLNSSINQADWYYFKEYIEKFSNGNDIKKINKFLYVHN